MSRSFAQIPASRFDEDPTFLSLPPEAQITEVFLLTRPLNLCGRVVLRYRFWAKALTNGDEGELRRRVALLVAAGRVWVDEDSEEVLIAGFPQSEGVLKNPKLITGMTTGFVEIDSMNLRSEFVRSLPDGVKMPENGSELTRRYGSRTGSIPNRYPIDAPSREKPEVQIPDRPGIEDITDYRLDISDNKHPSDVGKPPPPPPKRRDDLLMTEAMEVFDAAPSCGAWATEVVKRAKSLDVPVRSLARLVVRFQALDGATDLAGWTAPGRNPEVVWAAASILQAHPNLTATEISERWARWRESGNHKFKGWRGFASAWPTLGANPSSDPDHPDETYDEAMERLYAAAVRSQAAIETQGAIA